MGGELAEIIDFGLRGSKEALSDTANAMPPLPKGEARFAGKTDYIFLSLHKKSLQCVALEGLLIDYYRLLSRASIFLMGSQIEETLISWLIAATK